MIARKDIKTRLKQENPPQTMKATTNNESTTTEQSPYHEQQPRPSRGVGEEGVVMYISDTKSWP